MNPIWFERLLSALAMAAVIWVLCVTLGSIVVVYWLAVRP